MQTLRNASVMSFPPLGARRTDVDFNAGFVSSDGGLLLLAQTASRMDLFEQVAECFTDHRDPERVEHTVAQLVAQRVLGLCMGYEDLNDHDTLRYDPLFATAVGKLDPLGRNRTHRSCEGAALAGHATLNRLEHAPVELVDGRPDLKILRKEGAVEELIVKLFVDSYDEPPKSIVLDVDASHDPLYGQQEGAFYNGHYHCYCYRPLYIFCGDRLVASQLQTSDQAESKDAFPHMQRVVEQIRVRWPDTHILFRADAAYSRDDLMTWCEKTPGVDYVFGLSKNRRLNRMIADQLDQAKQGFEHTQQATRVFTTLRYRTHKSWSKERLVVAKAEHIPDKPNPRFIVTSLPIEDAQAQALYEQVYCERGEAENRIKEQQLGLFSERTSAHLFQANQMRLWMSAIGFVLLTELRRVGLQGTSLAKAQTWTIREKLLKIGARIRISVRRVWVSMSSAFPYQDVFRQVWKRLKTPRQQLYEGAAF